MTPHFALWRQPLQGTQEAADLKLLAGSYNDPVRQEVEAGPFFFFFFFNLFFGCVGSSFLCEGFL